MSVNPICKDFAFGFMLRDEEECKLEYSDDAAPTVTSFTPTTVVAGDDIVISGTGFDETTSASILGTTMNCTLDDAETITCGAPSIASGVHELVVTSIKRVLFSFNK